MDSKDLIALKGHILSTNTYFDKGFANAFKDSKSKQILAKTDNEQLAVVFPLDNEGSYFYLRNEQDIKYTKGLSVSDGIDAFDDTLNAFLIAVVKNADSYVLADNIRKTCLNYKPLNILPLSANWNREQIVIDEMKSLPDTDIQAALQRLGSQTVLRIKLQIIKRYIPNNCEIENPCKNC